MDSTTAKQGLHMLQDLKRGKWAAAAEQGVNIHEHQHQLAAQQAASRQ
jgi:hypothetical protein